MPDGSSVKTKYTSLNHFTSVCIFWLEHAYYLGNRTYKYSYIFYSNIISLSHNSLSLLSRPLIRYWNENILTLMLRFKIKNLYSISCWRALLSTERLWVVIGSSCVCDVLVIFEPLSLIDSSRLTLRRTSTELLPVY